jgi:multidrug transporter EmrE-like cation transporter
VGRAVRLLAVPVLIVSLIGGDEMNAVKIAGIVLIVAGVLGLAYGSFSYTKDTHEVKLGPIELSVKDKETVNVPVWAGVGAIVIGGVLLLFGSKKS